MPRAYAQIAFTPTVQAVQAEQGSAASYQRFLSDEMSGGDVFGPDEIAFIEARDGFYQASVSETGWPYVQYRGGPVGFVHVIDERTLAYADFRGNRQYVSAGNLRGNDRIALFFMDYPNRRRLKVYAHATLIGAQQDRDLIARLHDGSYRAKPERAYVLTLAALDWNCPQHIVPRFTAAELAPQLERVQRELARLQAENERLYGELGRLQAGQA
ncbi:MAG: pyridoxamine 5'-phosphate oxidase family protein [Geminicoccaceae bacterium]